jgi:hypothetical protein
MTHIIVAIMNPSSTMTACPKWPVRAAKFHCQPLFSMSSFKGFSAGTSVAFADPLQHLVYLNLTVWLSYTLDSTKSAF